MEAGDGVRVFSGGMSSLSTRPCFWRGLGALEFSVT